MIYAITGAVNGENTELGGTVSKGRIEDKITKVEDSSKVFLISTLNAEGKEGEKMMTSVKMTECSNRNLKIQILKNCSHPPNTITISLKGLIRHFLNVFLIGKSSISMLTMDTIVVL